jgi:hypothetical protein
MEILKMLKIAFAEHTMVTTQVFEWFSKFRSSVTSAADTKYSGHTMMSKTDEYIHQYQTVSKNNLNMHWHATKFVPHTCSLCFVCVSFWPTTSSLLTNYSVMSLLPFL